MSDSFAEEECCSDGVLNQIDDESDDIFDIRIVFVILLSVIFVRIFDYLSNKVNINLIEIMGNLFSRLTGNCSNPEDDNRSLQIKSKPEPTTGSQVNVPEIRKHSSTPISPTDATQKQLQKSSAKQLLAKQTDKTTVNKDKDNVKKDRPVFTTTFETQVDAAPPHPLEQKFHEVELDQIEIDTNLFTPEMEDAVVKIQAGLRGYLTRKHVNEMKKDIEDSAVTSNEWAPVVPPPKNFENQSLSPSNDLDQWKRLSEHLEEKIIDGIDNQLAAEEQKVQPIINGITESVIPLKDSGDNRVIETYVCKENILDVEPNEEQTAVPKTLKNTTEEQVVEKVFNVLKSETEFGETIDLIETNTETKIEEPVEVVVEPAPQVIDETVDSIVVKDVTETAESEVLAKLNEILDNNDDKDFDNNLNSTEEQKPIEETVQTKAVEVVSQMTTQDIIRNSFQEFVKEMTNSHVNSDSVPKIEEPEVKSDAKEPEVSLESEKSAEEVKPKPIPEERKTDSMLFEEEVVQTMFDEELSKTQNKQQIFAIELFQQDVTEEQLANVTTLCEPEPTARNMWGVEDSVVFKASVDEFVIKPVVEPQTPTESLESENNVNSFAQVLETPPILDREQKIQIFTSESRKNSEDLLESEVVLNEEPLIQTLEVLPLQSPVIQIDETEQNGRPLDEEEAAIRIQAAFRGFQIRRSLSREASPNRGSNHNNTDSNNNHNNAYNGIDVDFNENEIQTIHTTLQPNEDLIITSEPTEELLNSDQNSNENPLIVSIDEQIDTSLEKLEDQLMQELMSSSAEEEDRTQALIDDNLDPTQRLLDEMDISGDLTAPLLLQRIQKSLSSNGSNADSVEEQNIEEVVPETVPTDDQTEQTHTQEDSAAVEDRPLIEKSDTIIDLMSSSPHKIIESVIFTEDLLKITQSFNCPDTQFAEDLDDVYVEESPIIVSEVLKHLETKPIDSQRDVKTDVKEEKPLIPKPEAVPEPEPQLIVETESQEFEFKPKTEPENQLIVSELQEPIKIEETEPIVSQTTELLKPEPEEQKTESISEIKAEPEITESLKPESNGVLELDIKREFPIEATFESNIEPPTPDLREVTPELSFIRSSEQAVLTKICSTESEQDTQEVMSSDKIIESRPSLIPVLESHNKSKSVEQKDTFKKPKPILKESDPKLHSNIIPDEYTHSTSEDISSPDDENPEFVGLGPNTPIPVRASSPNPFGKKRRRGKKGTSSRK